MSTLQDTGQSECLAPQKMWLVIGGMEEEDGTSVIIHDYLCADTDENAVQEIRTKWAEFFQGKNFQVMAAVEVPLYVSVGHILISHPAEVMDRFREMGGNPGEVCDALERLSDSEQSS